MYEPKPLKAEFNAYEPYISEEIMCLHYSKHYLSYIKNLNGAIEQHPEFFKLEIPRLLSRLNEIPESIREVVRNNGGGVINHEILWSTLATKETEIHDGKFKRAICDSFESWEKFYELFVTAGSKLFGSGWVWLVICEHKTLKICTTSNQDSPYMDGNYPVFGVDVWEHAYYLQHKNIKANYLQEIWKIMDWREIEKRFLTVKEA